MAESVDYNVSSDEEEGQGPSVAPVVGWQTTVPASQLPEMGREEQTPVEGATATLEQHEATVSQVKEPEEDETPKEPLTASETLVDSTQCHMHHLLICAHLYSQHVVSDLFVSHTHVHIHTLTHVPQIPPRSPLTVPLLTEVDNLEEFVRK